MAPPMWLHRPDVIKTSPKIPTRDRTIRTPRRGDALHLLRLRQFRQSIRFLHRRPNPQIARRQHIHPPQREDQKHVTVQTPTPFTRVRCSITSASSSLGAELEIDLAIPRQPRQLPDVGHFLLRKSQRPASSPAAASESIPASADRPSPPSSKRPKIVEAAFPFNCWYTIDRTSV